LALDLYQAEAVMSTPIFTVKPEDSLWTVQQTMLQHLIHRLVVTGDQGELLGIITQTSLLQAINPLEIYRLAEVLEARVEQLEGKKITLLQNRTLELEQQVKTSVQQGQQRYESLAAAAPVGIFHTDAMGDYLYVNDRWCGIAGLTREAALGKGWLQGVHPQTRELVAQAWFQSVKNQVPFQLEYRFHSDDGEVTWVQTQAVTEQDLAGQVVGYVGTIIDISDRKRVEQELKRLNHELGMRVAARTVLLRTAVDELQAEVIRRAMLEEDLRDANLRLQELAQTDGLTQVANRRRFDQMLEQEWLRCQREQVPLSLVLFDVDYFKHYNDHNGHQQGDDCLIQLAQASSRAVRRPGDLVARYGGEEFALLLPHTDRVGAITIAQRLQTEIKILGIPHGRSSISPVVTVSMGIATLIPRRGPHQTNSESPLSQDLSSQDLLAQADQALYQAKQSGRNRYVVYAETLGSNE
jgi:diguanylate cyclase (GGDEF)-like protein/PAS domain S-box-containing protein